MIRLILICTLFLISLLSVFKAPAYYLWLLEIIVTEYPVLFAGIVSLLLLSGFWVQKYQLAGTIIGIVALMLILSPIARAYKVSRGLNSQVTATFGPGSIIADDNRSPFSFSKLFAGNKVIAYKTFNYVSYPDTTLTLDFYPAQIIGNRPCVIIIHGGAWNIGDSRQLPELNSYLARKGYNVVSVNYRLAPKYQSPAPVIDVKAALKYLHENAVALNIDTNNFVLLGRSAGAQVALMAAYTLNNLGIKGVIDFYGPADMVWGYSLPANPLVMDSRAVMRDYLGGAYDAVPQNYAASSPIEFVSPQTVPTLIIHGENDVLVAYEHSRRLNAKLEKYGVKHYWLKLPWATHGFDFSFYGPGGQLSTYTIERFLHAVTP